MYQQQQQQRSTNVGRRRTIIAIAASCVIVAFAVAARGRHRSTPSSSSSSSIPNEVTAASAAAGGRAASVPPSPPRSSMRGSASSSSVVLPDDHREQSQRALLGRRKKKRRKDDSDSDDPDPCPGLNRKRCKKEPLCALTDDDECVLRSSGIATTANDASSREDFDGDAVNVAAMVDDVDPCAAMNRKKCKKDKSCKYNRRGGYCFARGRKPQAQGEVAKVTDAPPPPPPSPTDVGAVSADDARCPAGLCRSPESGACEPLGSCFRDPCDASPCDDDQVCSSNYCGGCHRVCSPRGGGGGGGAATMGDVPINPDDGIISVGATPPPPPPPERYWPMASFADGTYECVFSSDYPETYTNLRAQMLFDTYERCCETFRCGNAAGNDGAGEGGGDDAAAPNAPPAKCTVEDEATSCADSEFCHLPTGTCDDPSSSGVCAARSELCIEMYLPVCGCDGRTHDNECKANEEGTSVLHEGPCARERPPPVDSGRPTSPIMEGPLPLPTDDLPPSQGCGPTAETCAESEFCLVDGEGGGDACDPASALRRGRCVARPFGCGKLYLPVCGCDGTTYNNECMANEAGQGVSHAGACEGRGSPKEPPFADTMPTPLSFDEDEEDSAPPDATKCTVDPANPAAAMDACGESQFCRVDDGACDPASPTPPGHHGYCAERPFLCPMLFAPVCGCDGRTHGSACEANGAGTSVMRVGACEDDDEDRTDADGGDQEPAIVPRDGKARSEDPVFFDVLPVNPATDLEDMMFKNHQGPCADDSQCEEELTCHVPSGECACDPSTNGGCDAPGQICLVATDCFLLPNQGGCPPSCSCDPDDDGTVLDGSNGCPAGEVCRAPCAAADLPGYMCFASNESRDCAEVWGPGYVCRDSNGDGVMDNDDYAAGCVEAASVSEGKEDRAGSSSTQVLVSLPGDDEAEAAADVPVLIDDSAMVIRPAAWWPVEEDGPCVYSNEYSDTYVGAVSSPLLFNTEKECCAGRALCVPPASDEDPLKLEYWWPHEDEDGARTCLFDAGYPDGYRAGPHSISLLFETEEGCCAAYPSACAADVPVLIDDSAMAIRPAAWWPVEEDGPCVYSDEYSDAYVGAVSFPLLFDTEKECCANRALCAPWASDEDPLKTEYWWPHEYDDGARTCLFDAEYPDGYRAGSISLLFETEEGCCAAYPSSCAATALASSPMIPEYWHPHLSEAGESDCVLDDEYDPSHLTVPDVGHTFLFDSEADCCAAHPRACPFHYWYPIDVYEDDEEQGLQGARECAFMFGDNAPEGFAGHPFYQFLTKDECCERWSCYGDESKLGSSGAARSTDLTTEADATAATATAAASSEAPQTAAATTTVPTGTVTTAATSSEAPQNFAATTTVRAEVTDTTMTTAGAEPSSAHTTDCVWHEDVGGACTNSGRYPLEWDRDRAGEGGHVLFPTAEACCEALFPENCRIVPHRCPSVLRLESFMGVVAAVPWDFGGEDSAHPPQWTMDYSVNSPSDDNDASSSSPSLTNVPAEGVGAGSDLTLRFHTPEEARVRCLALVDVHMPFEMFKVVVDGYVQNVYYESTEGWEEMAGHFGAGYHKLTFRVQNANFVAGFDRFDHNSTWNYGTGRVWLDRCEILTASAGYSSDVAATAFSVDGTLATTATTAAMATVASSADGTAATSTATTNAMATGASSANNMATAASPADGTAAATTLSTTTASPMNGMQISMETRGATGVAANVYSTDCVWHQDMASHKTCTNSGRYPLEWDRDIVKDHMLFATAEECCKEWFPKDCVIAPRPECPHVLQLDISDDAVTDLTWDVGDDFLSHPPQWRVDDSVSSPGNSNSSISMTNILVEGSSAESDLTLRVQVPRPSMLRCQALIHVHMPFDKLVVLVDGRERRQYHSSEEGWMEINVGFGPGHHKITFRVQNGVFDVDFDRQDHDGFGLDFGTGQVWLDQCEISMIGTAASESTLQSSMTTGGTTTKSTPTSFIDDPHISPETIGATVAAAEPKPSLYSTNCVWHRDMTVDNTCTNSGKYPLEWDHDNFGGQELFSTAEDCCELLFPDDCNVPPQQECPHILDLKDYEDVVTDMLWDFGNDSVHPAQWRMDDSVSSPGHDHSSLSMTNVVVDGTGATSDLTLRIQVPDWAMLTCRALVDVHMPFEMFTLIVNGVWQMHFYQATEGWTLIRTGFGPGYHKITFRVQNADLIAGFDRKDNDSDFNYGTGQVWLDQCEIVMANAAASVDVPTHIAPANMTTP